MRASSRENQRPDRERLIFAVCYRCKQTTAVYIDEGEDVAVVLYENNLRPMTMEGIYSLPWIAAEHHPCCPIAAILPPPESQYQQVLKMIEEDMRKMLPQVGPKIETKKGATDGRTE